MTSRHGGTGSARPREGIYMQTQRETHGMVGSKLDLYRENSGLGKVKFTQPVLVRKLEEEYTPPAE